MRIHLNDTVRGKMRPGQPKWTKIFDQPDDAKLTVEKDRIDGEEHPECMNPLAGTKPEPSARSEPTAKHQSTQPCQKGVRQPDIRRDALPS